MKSIPTVLNSVMVIHFTYGEKYNTKWSVCQYLNSMSFSSKKELIKVCHSTKSLYLIIRENTLLLSLVCVGDFYITEGKCTELQVFWCKFKLLWRWHDCFSTTLSSKQNVSSVFTSLYDRTKRKILFFVPLLLLIQSSSSVNNPDKSLRFLPEMSVHLKR